MSRLIRLGGKVVHVLRRHPLARRVAALAVAACLAAVGSPGAAFARPLAPPPVKAPAAELLTLDGQVLWSRGPQDQRPVASTIKMLNALVVRERASLDEVVVVPAAATRVESGCGLVAGEERTVRELLTVMLVASANDAAAALAIHIGGTEERFVGLMNAKAAELGATRTKAVDPHGLSERELSTAEDLTIIARRVHADPALRAMVATEKVTLPPVKGRKRELKNTNELLGEYDGMDGVKTGYTSSAGYCLVAAARRGELGLMTVVLGSRSMSSRFAETRELLDWGFGHFHTQTLVSTEQTGAAVPVADYLDLGVRARPAREVRMTLFDGGGPLERRVALDEWASAPVRRGQTLGSVSVYQDGTLLATVPLVATRDVPIPRTRERVYTLAVRVWERVRTERPTPRQAWARLQSGWPALTAAVQGRPNVAAAETAPR